MRLLSTALAGAYLVEAHTVEDMRGYFARLWSADDLGDRSLDTALAQASLSHNRLAGTLRGLHYQRAPFAESKLIRCVRGAVYDVIVDLRPDRPSFRNWFGVELSAENGRMLYVPPGVAHGYITLFDDSDVLYFLSAPYRADHAAGVRWNDPSIGITWPQPPRVISERDAAFPDYAP